MHVRDHRVPRVERELAHFARFAQHDRAVASAKDSEGAIGGEGDVRGRGARTRERSAVHVGKPFHSRQARLMEREGFSFATEREKVVSGREGDTQPV